MEASELQEIVQRSLERGPACIAGAERQYSGLPEHWYPGKPVPFNVVRFEGKWYKVRTYPTAESAQSKLELLRFVRDLFPACYGRAGRHLVFEYITDGLSPLPSLSRIGEYLARLESVRIDQRYEVKFEILLETLSRAGVFLPGSIELLRSFYLQNVSKFSGFRLQHHDAVPRNFVMAGGKVTCVDEKHLRVSPRGASLINPMLELSQSEFLQVKLAYLANTRVPLSANGGYWNLLTFYHLAYFLAYWAENVHPMVGLRRVRWAWFHRYRSTLMRIAGAPMVSRLREEGLWLVRHPLHDVARDFRRVRTFMAHRLGALT